MMSFRWEVKMVINALFHQGRTLGNSNDPGSIPSLQSHVLPLLDTALKFQLRNCFSVTISMEDVRHLLDSCLVVLRTCVISMMMPSELLLWI